MRYKGSFIFFLSAGCVFLTALNGWAAPVEGRDSRLGSARGVACYVMGYNAELLGAVDEAVDYYRQSVQEDGSSWVVRLRLAQVLAQQGRYSDAIRSAEEAARLNPEDLAAHYFLALLHTRLKDGKRSAAEYEFIFKRLALKNPENSEFPKYLGQVYYANGQDEQAMEQFASALKLDPKDCSLLYILGTYYLDRDRRTEGFALIKQCLDVDAGNADCLNSLAYSYAEDNVYLDKALQYVNAALVAEPANAAYLDTLGWVYYRLGRYKDALRELKRADAILKDPIILGHLTDVLLKLGNSAEAKKYQQEKEQTLNVRNKETP